MCSQQLKIGKHIKKLEIYWFIVLFCLLLIWFLIWLCCLSICCCVLFSFWCFVSSCVGLFVVEFCYLLLCFFLCFLCFINCIFTFVVVFCELLRCPVCSWVLVFAVVICELLHFPVCRWVFLTCRCVLWFCCCMWSVVLSYFALCFVICSCFLSFAVMICSSGPPYESDLFPSHFWRLVFV